MSPTRSQLRRWLTSQFLADVWDVCAAHGGSITSGIRSDRRNTAVGGHPQSRHRYESGWGLACDAVFDELEGRTAAKVEMAGKGWHSYIGPDYEPTRIHFQAFRHGEPLPKLE